MNKKGVCMGVGVHKGMNKKGGGQNDKNPEMNSTNWLWIREGKDSPFLQI